MGGLKYQRQVIWYHGCDKSVVAGVLLKGRKLKQSKNDCDWLGHGICFWEHDPQRAHDWAGQGKNVKYPSVIGALINLGNCFDLLATTHTQLLGKLFPLYCEMCEKTGRPLPANRSPKNQNSDDQILRYLDCAVLNWCLDFLDHEESQHYLTVRCLFSEGKPAFEGCKILAKSHVQIAVRDESAFVGYFKPPVDKKLKTAFINGAQTDAIWP